MFSQPLSFLGVRLHFSEYQRNMAVTSMSRPFPLEPDGCHDVRTTVQPGLSYLRGVRLQGDVRGKAVQGNRDIQARRQGICLRLKHDRPVPQRL